MDDLKADAEAAYRMSDTIALHLAANSDIMNAVGKWAAFRLSDGSSDGILYDAREDAIRHQFHELQCCYVCIPLTGMSPRDALSFLQTHRKLYDAGFKLTDPGILVTTWPANSNFKGLK